MNPTEFANKIRAKYPGSYNNISDLDLTKKVIAKYPVYASQVKLGQSEGEKSLYERKVVEPLGNVSEGVAKGVLSTAKGLGTIGTTVLDKLTGSTSQNMPGADIYRKGTEAEIRASEALTPEGTAQSIGYGAEKIAELFLPASKIAKAEKAADLMFKGSGLLSATERVLAKSAISAVPTATIVSAQTGSVKEGVKAGTLAGGVRAGMAVIGEGARALHLPERLYSTIFKNSAKDMITELKSGGLTNLQRNNPSKFNDLVKKGIIKVAPDGSPVLNDTLAEQALDKGLKGSIRGMADEVVEKTLESEEKVQSIANTYGGSVGLGEPQFVNVLKKIAGEYEDVGFGEISDEAKTLASKIVAGKGKVDGETAVKVKRFLDRVRIASSYDKPIVNLSTSQGNLKTLSDAVRSRVNKIPGMGEVMKNYSFYIDALESLAREASRRGNNQVLSLIDSLFLSGAYAGNNPIPGVTMGMLRKLIMSAPGATYLGQALNKGVISAPTSGLLNVGSAGVQSQLTGQ